MTLKSVALLEKEIEELEKAHGLKPEADPEPEDTEETEEVVEEVSQPETTTTTEESKDDETWKSRYANLRRLQQKQAEELNSLKSQKQTPPTITAEQVAEWVKANPKAADIVKALALEVSPIEDVSQIKEEIERTKAMAKILKTHPDFEEVTESSAFVDWAEAQPQRLQEIIYSDKADDVIWALNLYKSSLEKVDPKKDAAKLVKTKAGATEPASKSSPVYSESMVQKMSLQEYEKHEEAILDAQRKGNFVYDLSGGAR